MILALLKSDRALLNINSRVREKRKNFVAEFVIGTKQEESHFRFRNLLKGCLALSFSVITRKQGERAE